MVVDRGKATRILRQAAAGQATLILTDHVRRRMIERKIAFGDVLGALKRGQIVEGPAPSPRGESMAKVAWRAGAIAVVVGLREGRPPVVVAITVMKER